MDPADILALYDRYQRREVTHPTMRREVVDGVVRQINEAGTSSTIIFSDLAPADLDHAIQTQIAYFSRLGHELEWKVYTHDRPPDLRERLAAHEVVAADPEALMVLDLEALPDKLRRPPRHAIRRISKPDQLSDVLTIQNTVWDDDFSRLIDELAAELRAAAESLSIYVAEAAGVTASVGWIRFDGRDTFASLWGGSTLPEQRGQGLYTDLLTVRAQEAIQRGVRFLTIDAGPMSRPIVERLGFTVLSHSYACIWRPESASGTGTRV
jgi:GNAT superfamily N-acetyltransferase